MDLIGFLGILIIAVFSGGVTVILCIEYFKRTFFFEDLAENLLKNVATDEELQKLLYQVGGIVGSGVKGGIGLDLPKKGTRFKWQDLLIDLASQYISKTLPIEKPYPREVSPSQTLINSEKNRDKW